MAAAARLCLQVICWVGLGGTLRSRLRLPGGTTGLCDTQPEELLARGYMVFARGYMVIVKGYIVFAKSYMVLARSCMVLARGYMVLERG